MPLTVPLRDIEPGLLNLLGSAFIKLATDGCPSTRLSELAVLGLGLRQLAHNGDMGPAARALVTALGLKQGSQTADLAQAIQVVVFDLQTSLA